MISNRITTAWALSLLLMSGIGCSSGQNLASIEGTVTIDGKPLEHGTILFEVSGARTAYGEIKDGKILAVTTFAPGDGVPIGEAQVAVNSVDTTPAGEPQVETGGGGDAPGGPTEMPMGRHLLPTKYSNPATSGLTVSIAPGKNDVVLELTSSGS